jgi:tRNA threonylcarbamoyladenosine biosynthesis protein TsaB
MASFRHVLDRHAPLLLLDACSAHIQVGWLAGVGEMRWATATEESGIGLFTCLEALAVNPTEARGFVFCDGPGSILGIRTSAMAIRAWRVLNPQPVFSFHSLELVSHFLGNPDLSVISDARRDAWHCVSLETPLRRIPTAELMGKLATPDGFRNWTPLPPQVSHVPYSLEEMLPRLLDKDLLREATEPDAFLHEEPRYVTWTPAIHRAP